MSQRGERSGTKPGLRSLPGSPPSARVKFPDVAADDGHVKSSIAIRTAVVLGGLVLAAAATPASAAEEPQSSFSIRPMPDGRGYFVFSARPRQTITGRFRIANTGTKPGVAYLYPVDGTTGATSGAVYLSRDAARRDVGGWLRLPIRRITLEPRQTKIVRFTVRVPKRVRSGDHLGGIVAENAEISGAPASGGGSGLNIRIRRLSIVAVQVNLPGPRLPKLEFDGVSVGAGAGYQILYLTLGNRGNVMVKSKLSVRITGPARHLAYARELELDTFVPKTGIAFPFYLLRRPPLAPGRYQLTGLLAYEKRSTRFTAFFEISRSDVAAVASPPATTTGESETPVGESGERWLSSLRSWTARPELLLAVGGLAAGTVVPFLVLVARRRRKVGKVSPAPDLRKDALPGPPHPSPADWRWPTAGRESPAGQQDNDSAATRPDWTGHVYPSLQDRIAAVSPQATRSSTEPDRLQAPLSAGSSPVPSRLALGGLREEVLRTDRGSRPMESRTSEAVEVADDETDHEKTSELVGLEYVAAGDASAPSAISPELVLVCPELREQLIPGC